MRLDEATMGLGPEPGDHLLARRDDPVKPRRQRCERRWQLGGLEDEQGADHLHPGRAALGPGADNDIARPEGESFPPRAVLVVRLVPDRLLEHLGSVVESAIPIHRQENLFKLSMLAFKYFAADLRSRVSNTNLGRVVAAGFIAASTWISGRYVCRRNNPAVQPQLHSQRLPHHQRGQRDGDGLWVG